MIEKLTDAQIAKFPEYVKKWTDIGLSCDPLDFERAKRGVMLAYESAGKSQPKKIVVCDSPLSGSITASILKSSVRASVGDSVRASVRASVRDSVWDSVRASVWASVWDSVWAYSGSFFKLKRSEWKYCENIKSKRYPFDPAVCLWNVGLVPGFDGKVWRLHGEKDAKVLWEGKI